MAPGRIGSHYLLHEQIGQGGMGTVWRAEDTATGTWRAVKVLKPEYARDPASVARFVRERNALLALAHPNVVTLHDMIVEGERLALVMDLLTEGDLDQCRREHGGAMPPGLAAELTAQVCDGLAAAHAAGIVHRDLKPANVLMDAGRARLSDFGIARIAGEPSVTTAGAVIGTLRYMAPEALAGAAPAPASDVYAAGVTLYELLAGEPPFTGEVAAIVYHHVHSAPARPDGLPDPLWQLVAACLAKDPAARPAAAQLAAGLRRLGAASGAPADAGRPAPAALAESVPEPLARSVPGAPGAPERASTAPAGGSGAGTTWRGSVKRRRAWGAAAVAVVAGGGISALAAFGSGPAGSHAPRPAASRTASPPAAAAPSRPAASHAPAASPAPTASAAPTTSPAPATHSAPAVTGWVIENTRSKLCLNAGTSAAGGAGRVDQAPCSVDPAEQWRVTARVTLTGHVFRQYKNGRSGLCLSVAGPSSGARLIQQACAGGKEAQLWQNHYITGSDYEFVNGQSGLCMGTVRSSTVRYSGIDQGRCATAAGTPAAQTTQVWITVAGPGFLRGQ